MNETESESRERIRLIIDLRDVTITICTSNTKSKRLERLKTRNTAQEPPHFLGLARDLRNSILKSSTHEEHEKLGLKSTTSQMKLLCSLISSNVKSHICCAEFDVMKDL